MELADDWASGSKAALAGNDRITMMMMTLMTLMMMAILNHYYKTHLVPPTGGTTTLVDLVMPERGDSLVEAFNIWKEAGEDAACCDFALAVTVPQMDDQTRFTFIVIAIIINVVTIITTSMKGRHGAVVQGAGRQLLQAVHVPEGPADA